LFPALVERGHGKLAVGEEGLPVVDGEISLAPTAAATAGLHDDRDDRGNDDDAGKACRQGRVLL